MISWKCTTGFLYQTNYARERARQRRDRKSDYVRDRALLEVGDNIGNKIDRYRKHLWQLCEINYQGDQDAANDVVPTISMFPLRIY